MAARSRSRTSRLCTDREQRRGLGRDDRHENVAFALGSPLHQHQFVDDVGEVRSTEPQLATEQANGDASLGPHDLAGLRTHSERLTERWLRSQLVADRAVLPKSRGAAVTGSSFAGLVAGLAGPHGSVTEGDVEVGVGEQFEVEVVAVDVVVVTVAEQHQVLEVCIALVAPVVDVVGVAPGDFAVAARESAAAIASSHSTEQVFGHGVGCPPVVQDRVAGA